MFIAELTDTFAGKANYAWVRRAAIDLPPDTPDAKVKRAAKAAFGMAGTRGEWADIGETLEFRPRHACTILFVTYHG